MSKEEVKPKEQPILMSTPMVVSLLNGTKTETRRDKNMKDINLDPDNWTLDSVKGDFYYFTSTNHNSELPVGKKIKCPWRVGNVLWVKETWKPSIIPADGGMGEYPMIRYKADSFEVPVPTEDYDWFMDLTKNGKYNYQSSMFMRRKFARIFLQITDIKLERIQDITEEGAIAEGIERFDDGTFNNYRPLTRKQPAKFLKLKSPIDSYKSLWDNINGSESWDKNIFCWCVKFEKLNSYNGK